MRQVVFCGISVVDIVLQRIPVTFPSQLQPHQSIETFVEPAFATNYKKPKLFQLQTRSIILLLNLAFVLMNPIPLEVCIYNPITKLMSVGPVFG